MSSGGGGMFSVNFIFPLPLSFRGLPPSTSLAMNASSREESLKLDVRKVHNRAPPRHHASDKIHEKVCRHVSAPSGFS
jgi:hypothetical protein